MRMILVPIAAAITLSACSLAAPSTRELTDQGEVEPISVGWSKVTPAEAVELPSGKPFSGKGAHPGAGQPVLINFWLSTCGPCGEEMPLLQELSTSGEAMVIGVTRDRYASFANEVIDRAGVTYPNYQDFLGNYAATFHGVVPLGSIPVSVLVIDGKAERIHLGPFRDMRELKAGLPG